MAGCQTSKVVAWIDDPSAVHDCRALQRRNPNAKTVSTTEFIVPTRLSGIRCCRGHEQRAPEYAGIHLRDSQDGRKNARFVSSARVRKVQDVVFDFRFQVGPLAVR
jgi:hypothetical protein